MERWGRFVKGILCLVLFVAAAPAAAQTVQKCVDRKGHVTLTSGACPAGQRETASYDATPERETAEQRRRRANLEHWEREQAVRRSAQSTTVYYGAPPRSVPNARHQRCQAAKQERDSALARLGLRRTHDQLRYWDGYVYERCK